MAKVNKFVKGTKSHMRFFKKICKFMKSFDKLWEYFESQNNTLMTKHFEDFYTNFMEGIKHELNKEIIEDTERCEEESEEETEESEEDIQQPQEEKEVVQQQEEEVEEIVNIRPVKPNITMIEFFYPKNLPALPAFIDYDIGFTERNLDLINDAIVIKNRPQINIFVNRYFFKNMNVLSPEERGRSYIVTASNPEGIFTKKELFLAVVRLLKTIMSEQIYEKSLRNVKLIRFVYNHFHQNYIIEYQWSHNFFVRNS